MQWEFIVALIVAIPIILVPVVFVWYLNIGGIYHAIREARQRRRAAREERVRAEAKPEPNTAALAIMGRRVRTMALALGRPMPMVLLIAVPVAVYAFVVWFLFTRFGWEVTLAVGLALPIIVIPPALVWYVTVWGTYEIIRDGRARQKRRAELLREAEALVRGEVPVIISPEADAADFWVDKESCWEMSHCPPEIRDECPAYGNRSLPCWEIEGTYSKLCMEGTQANGRDTTICQICPIYKKYGEGVPIHLRLVGAGIDTLLTP